MGIGFAADFAGSDVSAVDATPAPGLGGSDDVVDNAPVVFGGSTGATEPVSTAGCGASAAGTPGLGSNKSGASAAGLAAVVLLASAIVTWGGDSNASTECVVSLARSST